MTEEFVELVLSPKSLKLISFSLMHMVIISSNYFIWPYNFFKHASPIRWSRNVTAKILSWLFLPNAHKHTCGRERTRRYVLTYKTFVLDFTHVVVGDCLQFSVECLQLASIWSAAVWQLYSTTYIYTYRLQYVWSCYTHCLHSYQTVYTNLTLVGAMQQWKHSDNFMAEWPASLS